MINIIYKNPYHLIGNEENSLLFDTYSPWYGQFIDYPTNLDFFGKIEHFTTFFQG